MPLFVLLFKKDGSISSGTRHKQTLNKITTECHFDHHIIEEHLKGAHPAK